MLNTGTILFLSLSSNKVCPVSGPLWDPGEQGEDSMQQ